MEAEKAEVQSRVDRSEASALGLVQSRCPVFITVIIKSLIVPSGRRGKGAGQGNEEKIPGFADPLVEGLDYTCHIGNGTSKPVS